MAARERRVVFNGLVMITSGSTEIQTPRLDKASMNLTRWGSMYVLIF